MSEKKYTVTCPICGKVLFKSESESACSIDVQCPKCGSGLNIHQKQNILSVQEMQFKYKHSAPQKQDN